MDANVVRFTRSEKGLGLSFVGLYHAQGGIGIINRKASRKGGRCREQS
jgi:hypothetical protein